MASAGSLIVSVVADTGKFSGSLRSASSEIGGFASKITSGFGGMAGKLGAAGAAIGVGLSLGKFVSDAMEAEAVGKKLEAVLAATGGACGFTGSQLQEFAGDLQKVTNFEDDAVVSAMAVMATFKNIKGDVFKEATKAAMDMASVMGGDLQSAVVQIAKALNDPAEGLAKLAKVGVTFTEEQKEQIKGFMEQGKVLEAQKVILKELGSEFGGAAAAMADPLTQAKNAVGNLGEAIGLRLLPYLKLGAQHLKEMADAAAKAAAEGKTTGDRLRDMTPGQKMTSFDWWARGLADLGMALEQGIDFASLFTSFSTAEEKTAEFDDFFKRFAEAQTPSEQLDAIERSGNAAAAGLAKAAAAGAGLKNIGDGAKDAAAGLGDMDSLLKDIQSELDKFGKQGLRDRLSAAEQQGITPEQRENAGMLLDELDRRKAGEDIAAGARDAESAIDALDNKIQQLAMDLAGMTEGEKTVFDLEGKGVSDEQLAQVRERAAAYDEMTRQQKEFQKREEDFKLGERMAEQFRTPAEQYQTQLEEIQRLFEMGALGEGAVGERVAGRAIDDARKKYDQQTGLSNVPQFAGDYARGSKEAYQLMAQWRSGSMRDGESDIPRRSLDVQDRIRQAIEDIRDDRTSLDVADVEE